MCALLASALTGRYMAGMFEEQWESQWLELSKGMEEWGVRSEVKERAAPY